MKGSVPLAQSNERSVERVLNILEALALWPEGVSLTDLAESVELPKATAHRLLGTLVSRGYVSKAPNSGKYRLTMRLFELGSYGGGGRHILTVALPYLEELSRQTDETLSLAVQDNTDMVYLFRGDYGSLGVRMPTNVGLRYPMYRCATGKSIMAALPSIECKALWEHSDIVAKTSHTIVNFEDFEREIALIRERGYACDNEEGDLGVRGVAVAIRNYLGRPIAAIGISALASHLSDEMIASLAPKLLAVVQKIEKAL